MLSNNYPVYDQQAEYEKMVREEEWVCVKIFITLFRFDENIDVPDRWSYGDSIRLNTFTKKWSLRCQT